MNVTKKFMLENDSNFFSPYSYCLSDDFRNLLFLGAGELAGRVRLCASRRAVSSCFLLQSLIPPFQVFSAVLRRNKSCLSCMVVLWGL